MIILGKKQYMTQYFTEDGKAHQAVKHRCTASIGVLMFLGAQSLAEDVLKRSDTAMYQAKAGGRNRVVFFDATDAQQSAECLSPVPA